MKLLAIRGQNLASLAGHFEVNLEEGPLAQAGLFAITGPTGSGKSTVLDALCLALYGRTPRLSDRGGVRIGLTEEERQFGMDANDARNLLRRGAVEGFAEVEFQGNDGLRYRAKWSVRRARNKAHGRVQTQSMEFERLCDQTRLGSKLEEVREEIVAKVGLTFEQFRRSVLLAQGDFAAFLKAKSDDRADLLEKMTQTQRYGEIGKQVYLEARAWEAKWIAASSELTRLGVLPAEKRQAAQLAWEAAAASYSQQTELVETLRTYSDWYKQQALLETQVAQGRMDLASWQQQDEALLPERQALQRTMKARELAPWITSLDKAQTESLLTVTQLEQATAQRALAHAQLQTSSEQIQRSATALQTLQAELDAASPEIQKARLLDQEAKRQTAETQQAQKFLTALSQEQSDADKTLAKCKQDIQALTSKLEAQDLWLANHPEDQVLAAQAESVSKGLTQLAATLEEQKNNQQRLVQAKQDGRKAEQTVAENQKALEATDQELGRAQQVLESVQSNQPSPGHQESLQQKESLETTLRLAEQGSHLCQQVLAKQAEKLSHQNTLTALTEQLGQAQDAQQQCIQQALVLEGRMAEAQLLLQDARDAATLDDRRLALQPGKACPLCGSTQHPWATHEAASGQLETRRQRTAELQAQLKEAQEAVSVAKSNVAGLQASIAARSANLSAVESDLQVLDKTWSLWVDQAQQAELPLQIGPGWPNEGSPSGVSVPRPSGSGRPMDATRAGESDGGPDTGVWTCDATSEPLVELVESTRQKLHLASKTVTLWAQHLASVEKAQAEVHKSRQKADTQQKALGVAQEMFQKAGLLLAPLEAESVKLETTQAQLIQFLEGPLAPYPQWNPKGAFSPQSLLQWLPEHLEVCKKRLVTREQTAAELQELHLRVTRLEEQASHIQKRLHEAQTANQEANGALQQTLLARAALLGGQAADAVQNRFNQAIATATSLLEKHRAEQEAAVRAATSAETRCTELEARQHTAKNELDAARHELELQLGLTGISLEEVRQACLVPAMELEQLAQRLQAARQALEKAEHVLEERTRLAREHGSTGQPPLEAPEVAEQLARAIEQAQPLKLAEEETRMLLRRDDRARLDSLPMEAQMHQLRQTWDRWEKLSGCIGSADGKKFRRFAQGLTLDALLQHANRHLNELAPRYVLSRVPGDDLELQVLDRDMGDEVRTINSLSGGETFLASLALALGLASLASKKTLVESLFIDEGFGTLDPETLESALSVLDSLQATGRKVGIISHVPGLAQQIGARVEVRKLGQGRSEVVTLGV